MKQSTLFLYTLKIKVHLNYGRNLKKTDATFT